MPQVGNYHGDSAEAEEQSVTDLMKAVTSIPACKSRNTDTQAHAPAHAHAHLSPAPPPTQRCERASDFDFNGFREKKQLIGRNPKIAIIGNKLKLNKTLVGHAACAPCVVKRAPGVAGTRARARADMPVVFHPDRFLGYTPVCARARARV